MYEKELSDWSKYFGNDPAGQYCVQVAVEQQFSVTIVIHSITITKIHIFNYYHSFSITMTV